MPLYKYKAVHKKSKRTINNKVSAVDLNDLKNKLLYMNCRLISAKKVKEKSLLSLNLKSSINSRELLIIYIYLKKLTEAGVSLLEGIESMIPTIGSNVLKNIMIDVHNDIKGGKMLYEAMENNKKIFGIIAVRIIAAGELSGNLLNAFDYLIRYLEWSGGVKSRFLKAVSYPILLLCMILCLCVVMVVMVLPKMVDFFLEQKIALPIYTRILLAISGFLQQYYHFVFLGLFLFALLLVLLKIFYSQWRAKVDHLKLKVPLLGKLFIKMEVAKFCSLFVICYSSGIDLLESMSISCDVVENVEIKGILTDARIAIVNGSTIADSFELSGVFPDLVTRLIRMGENSGDIKSALQKVVKFYDQEIEESISAFIASVKPVLILVAGLLLVWISISVFGPMYQGMGELVNRA